MKKIFFGIMVLLILFVAGCKTDQGTTGTKTTPFIGGITGLSIGFADNSPPKEVYDGGDYPFEAVVMLENKGEYDVKKSDVQIKLSGVRAEEFGISESGMIKNPDEDVLATQKDPEGNIRNGPPVYVEFTGLNHKEKLAGNTPFTFMAEVCYVYNTIANAQLCVREDNLETKESVCEVNEKKAVYNSGAPIQVISLTETPRSKDKVAFTFEVLHRGTGRVYKAETKCESERISEDKVWLEVSTDVGSGLDCSNLNGGTSTSGYATLYGGAVTVTCTLQKATSNDFETPVKIVVKYDYKETTTTDVLVKHQIS